MKTNILILCAGQINIESHDNDYPLCLTEIHGTSLLERIVMNTNKIENSHYTFALLDNDIKQFHLDRIATLLTPNATITCIPENTQGSACTALLAASQFDPDSNLLIISANELVDINLAEVIDDFLQRNLDGGMLIFRSVHPRYSYARLNNDKLVIEVAQKNPISHHATTGIFWFAKNQNFINGAENIIRKNAAVNGKFFVAPIFNELILRQAKIGTTEIDISKYHPLKDERQIQQFEHGVSS